MTEIALIRHGPTEWSASHRLQGRRDVPLSAAGRNKVAQWTTPAELKRFDWAASPLQRTMETARLLGADEVAPEPALIEMHWGEWEGAVLEDLRKALGPEMVRNEAQGLNFTPLGGESPRQVQKRLRAWFLEVVRRGRPVVAVTHKGVIHATLALATDWDMTGQPPVRLDWTCVHLFILDAEGMPRAGRLNVPLGGNHG